MKRATPKLLILLGLLGQFPVPVHGQEVLIDSLLALAHDLSEDGRSHLNQGRAEEALPLLVRALEIREARLAPDDPDLGLGLYLVGAAYERLRRHDEALPLLVRALEIQEAVLPSNDLDLARTLSWLGSTYVSLGRHNEALPLYERTLEIRDARLAPDHPDVAFSQAQLAWTYSNLGRHEEAAPLYEQALAIRELVLGSEHSDVAWTLYSLAWTYSNLGRHEEAAPLYEQALAIRELVLGPEHSDVALTLYYLAWTYGNLGRYEEAAPLYARALEIQESLLSPDNPVLTTTREALYRTYVTLGREGEAADLLPTRVQVAEPDHAVTLRNLNEQILRYTQRELWPAALYPATRALAIRDSISDPDDPELVIQLELLAEILGRLGRYDEALPLYTRALRVREEASEPDHPDLILLSTSLGLAYWMLDRYDEALPLYARALEGQVLASGLDHPDLIPKLDGMGGLLMVMEREAEALPLFARALEIQESASGLDHPDLLERLDDMAWVYRNLDRPEDEALMKIRELEIRESVLEPDDPDLVLNLRDLAWAYREIGKFEEAENSFLRLIKIVETDKGLDHPDVAYWLFDLDILYALSAFDVADKLEKRLSLNQRILSINEASVGKDYEYGPLVQPTSNMIMLNNIGRILVNDGRYAEASGPLERALAMSDSVVRDDPSDPMTLLGNAEVRLGLAFSYQGLYRYDEAADLLARALEIHELYSGREHTFTALVLLYSGRVYENMARYNDAEPLLQRALAIRTAELEELESNPNLPTRFDVTDPSAYSELDDFDAEPLTEVLLTLGNVYLKQARYTEAEKIYQDGLDIIEPILGPDDLTLTALLSNLGVLYHELARYEEAEEMYRRAIEIHTTQEGEIRLASMIPTSGLASLYGDLGRYQEAETLRIQVLEARLAALGPDHIDVGRAMGSLGDFYRSQADYTRADSLMRRSLEIQTSVLGPNHLLVGTRLHDLGALYYEMARYDEAENLVLRSMAIAEAAWGPNHPSVAVGMRTQATLYGEMGRFEKVIPLLTRMLDIAETTFGPNHPDVARSLMSHGSYLSDLGRYREAEEKYLRAESIFTAAYPSGSRELAGAMGNLGNIDYYLGRYESADIRLRQALDLSESLVGENHPDVGFWENSLAQVYVRQNRLAEAEDSFVRSLEIREASFGENHPDVAIGLVGLATALAQMDAHQRAEELYGRALTIFEASYGSNHQHVASTLNSLAATYREMGLFQQAENHYLRALVTQESVFGVDHPDVAYNLTDLADLYYSMGRFTEAISAVDRSISILESSAGNPSYRVSAHALRARDSYRRGDRANALSDLEVALSVLEELRPDFGGDERVRAGLIEEHGTLFDLMVSWQLEAGDPESALSWLERGRARVLLDQLAQAQVDLRAGISPDVLTPLEQRESEALTRRASFQAKITSRRTRRRLSSTNPASDIEALLDSLALADEEYQRANLDILSAGTLWRDVVTQSGEPVTLSEIQSEVVPADGLLLIYEIGDSSSHVFVIPPTGRELEVVSLDVTSRTLNEQIPAGEIVGSRDMDDLQGLREELFPEDLWDRVLGAQEIVVVPDGALHRLPFEALVVARDGEDVSYWLDEGPPVRYAASATTLYNTERRTSSGGSGVLSLSGAIFDLGEVRLAQINNRSSVRRAGFTRAGVGLDPLPYSIEETKKIQEAFGENEVTVLQGLNATESDLRKSLGNHRYLHLATHGLVDQRGSTMFARLAVTPVEAAEPDPDNDGFLDLREVYGLDLSSIALAVLSACETNIGERFVGEGVFALSRGFLAAGAQRVVATQWKVDDEATSVLVGALFEEIARAERAGEEMNYAQALHAAKQTLRNDPDNPRWNDPSYWAPFIITGQR